MQKAISILWMTWNMIALCGHKIFSALFRQKTEKDKFLAYYREDQLWPIFPEITTDIQAFSRCTSCGLCESFLTRLQPSEHEPRNLPLPQELVCGTIRNLPSLVWMEESLKVYEQHLEALTSLCPEHISFAQLIEWMRLYKQYQQEQSEHQRPT